MSEALDGTTPRAVMLGSEKLRPTLGKLTAVTLVVVPNTVL